jgi:hypothetical protein
MTNKVTKEKGSTAGSRHVHDDGRQETMEGRRHGFPIWK